MFEKKNDHLNHVRFPNERITLPKEEGFFKKLTNAFMAFKPPPKGMKSQMGPISMRISLKR